MSHGTPYQKVRAALANHSLDNDANEDNLAIMLCTYFEQHRDCPEEEPNEHGWQPWAEERCDRMLDQLAQAVVEALPEHERETEDNDPDWGKDSA